MRSLSQDARKRLAVAAVSVLAAAVITTAVVQAAAWPLLRTHWTDRDEQVYSDFVAALGRSRHGNLIRFIRDPQQNPLHGSDDARINLSPDCADLPYLLRAYVAYKLRLPFGYVSAISGGRGDQRYTTRVQPSSFKTHADFSTPGQLFGQLTLVNSGYFRMAPHVELSDTYPVRIRRESIVPGTVYYDPNGHVAIVCEVTDDGRIRLIDAHPDRSLTRPWFGAKFARGTPENGGGFRAWRPQWWGEGGIRRLPNASLPHFSATDQYARSYSFQNLRGLSYFDYVRMRLSNRGGRTDPAEEFQVMLAELQEDLDGRADAVNIAIARGAHRLPHPGRLPWNIYGTDGLWEELSTPSRDARLKVSLYDFFNRTVGLIRRAEQHDPLLTGGGSARQLAATLAAIWDQEAPRIGVTYLNSAKVPVRLDLGEIIRRIYRLSFDPYHSIERRWGAEGDELRSASDDAVKIDMYHREQRLRGQLERVYNRPTGFELGPDHPPDLDIRRWLDDYLGGRTSTGILAQRPPIGTDDGLPGEATPTGDLLANAGIAGPVATDQPAGPTTGAAGAGIDHPAAGDSAPGTGPATGPTAGSFAETGPAGAPPAVTKPASRAAGPPQSGIRILVCAIDTGIANLVETACRSRRPGIAGPTSATRLRASVAPSGDATGARLDGAGSAAGNTASASARPNVRATHAGIERGLAPTIPASASGTPVTSRIDQPSAHRLPQSVAHRAGEAPAMVRVIASIEAGIRELVRAARLTATRD